jgi:hypothetical protein
LQYKDDRFNHMNRKELEKSLKFYKDWYNDTICTNTRVYIRERVNEIKNLLNKQ